MKEPVSSDSNVRDKLVVRGPTEWNLFSPPRLPHHGNRSFPKKPRRNRLIISRITVVFTGFRVVRALAWAKNILWVRPCLSVCLSIAYFPTGRDNLQDRGSLLCNNGTGNTLSEHTVAQNGIGSHQCKNDLGATMASDHIGAKWPKAQQ
jgi:hypothetical protein